MLKTLKNLARGDEGRRHARLRPENERQAGPPQYLCSLINNSMFSETKRKRCISPSWTDWNLLLSQLHFLAEEAGDGVGLLAMPQTTMRPQWKLRKLQACKREQLLPIGDHPTHFPHSSRSVDMTHWIHQHAHIQTHAPLKNWDKKNLTPQVPKECFRECDVSLL